METKKVSSETTLNYLNAFANRIKKTQNNIENQGFDRFLSKLGSKINKHGLFHRSSTQKDIDTTIYELLEYHEGYADKDIQEMLDKCLQSIESLAKGLDAGTIPGLGCAILPKIDFCWYRKGENAYNTRLSPKWDKSLQSCIKVPTNDKYDRYKILRFKCKYVYGDDEGCHVDIIPGLLLTEHQIKENRNILFYITAIPNSELSTKVIDYEGYLDMTKAHKYPSYTYKNFNEWLDAAGNRHSSIVPSSLILKASSVSHFGPPIQRRKESPYIIGMQSEPGLRLNKF